MLSRMMKIFVLILAVAAASQAKESISPQRLVKDLLKDYMKEVDPGTTDLTFSLSYLCADLSRFTMQLTSKVLESYMWVDSRLRWDPSKYDGIQQFRLPANMIWTPDFKLYNTLSEAEVRDDVNAVVMANGTVLWIPMVVYKTYCEPAARDKGDSMACLLHLGSWTYDGDTLKLQSRDLDTSSMYLDACPYVITEPKVEVDTKVYPCCQEPYSSVRVTFGIHHRL